MDGSKQVKNGAVDTGVLSKEKVAEVVRVGEITQRDDTEREKRRGQGQSPVLDPQKKLERRGREQTKRCCRNVRKAQWKKNHEKTVSKLREAMISSRRV